jgi:membrane associated rhomboid family serine protease
MIPLRDANPTRRTPYMTLAIIVACFIGYAWELGLLASGGEAALDRFLTQWGVVPADLTTAWSHGDYFSAETATLITSQFLHGSWFHLLGNMLFLWIFGNNVEDRLGRAGFLLFYLAGGVLAGLSQVAIDPTSIVPTIGASGAIAAILGAYAMFFPRARVSTLVFLGFFYQLIDVPAILVLGFWFVLQILDGIVSTGPSAGGGIAFFAHIGGFVAGALAARVVILLGGRRRRPAVPPSTPPAPPEPPGPPAPPSVVPPTVG